MVLYDYQTTIVKILLILIGLILLCKTLNNGFWRSFNFQSRVRFHNHQIHHEIFDQLLVISHIKFCDGRKRMKVQS